MSGRVPQPVFCRTFGKGPRQLLALHCTMAHSGAWRGLADAMEGQVTVHATDMFCHGKSPDWDGQGDFQDRMMQAAAKHLNQPMDVIGHSFGATVALRLALEHPDRVRSLTMIEPVYFAFVRHDHVDILARENERSAPFREAIAKGDYTLAARVFNRGWGGDGGRKWDDLPEATRAAMTRGVHIVPACGQSILDDLHGVTQPGALAPATMPALLLRGSETVDIIRLTNEEIARRLPEATSEAIQGAGHMVPITHPAETADALRRLFARAPL